MGQQDVYSMEHHVNREIGFLDEYDDDVILGLWDQLQQMIAFYRKVSEVDLGVVTMLVYH